MQFKEKYPWSTLKNPGDTFELLPEWDVIQVRHAVYFRNKTKEQKYKLLVDLNQVIRTK